MSDIDMDAAIRKLEELSGAAAGGHVDEARQMLGYFRSSPDRPQIVELLSEMMDSVAKSSFILGLHTGARMEPHASAVLVEFMERVVLEHDRELIDTIKQGSDELATAAGGAH